VGGGEHGKGGRGGKYNVQSCFPTKCNVLLLVNDQCAASINQNKLSAINIQYQNNSHKSFQKPLGVGMNKITTPRQGRQGRRGGVKKTNQLTFAIFPSRKLTLWGILYVPFQTVKKYIKGVV